MIIVVNFIVGCAKRGAPKAEADKQNDIEKAINISRGSEKKVKNIKGANYETVDHLEANDTVDNIREGDDMDSDTNINNKNHDMMNTLSSG